MASDHDTSSDQHSARQIITIDLISDIICPWCYVGFRALVAACAARPNAPTAITLHPFELDATTPKQGVDYKARLLAKFGGDRARLDTIRASLVEAGLAVGIAFNLDAIVISPNTRDCHRLLRWARSANCELECAEALFQAYHVAGEDLSQADTLIRIAHGLGMDSDLIGQLLSSDSAQAGVQLDLEAAEKMGITSVPCAVFNQQFVVMGAQPVTAFITAVETAARQMKAS